MKEEKKVEVMLSDLAKDESLTDENKKKIALYMNQLRETKINILITGSTGCGKSSTINALFDLNVAKVGQGVDPETMDIQKYELNNIILWDSPGLGDGKEKDRKHAENITSKLCELDKDGNALIDLVLVIIDGSSRDLGTSYELINQVVLPALDYKKDRLIVAINQCDIAMKGRYWNAEKNEPEKELIKFLEEKVESTKRRIKESTGVDIEPIYYSAGYKEGNNEQKPYNLSKLLMLLVLNTKKDKRTVYLNDINKDKKMWEKDDRLDNYREKTKKSVMESLVEKLGEIGETVVKTVETIGKIVETVSSTITKIGKSISSIFPW